MLYQNASCPLCWILQPPSRINGVLEANPLALLHMPALSSMFYSGCCIFLFRDTDFKSSLIIVCSSCSIARSKSHQGLIFFGFAKAIRLHHFTISWASRLNSGLPRLLCFCSCNQMSWMSWLEIFLYLVPYSCRWPLTFLRSLARALYRWVLDFRSVRQHIMPMAICREALKLSNIPQRSRAF